MKQNITRLVGKSNLAQAESVTAADGGVPEICAYQRKSILPIHPAPNGTDCEPLAGKKQPTIDQIVGTAIFHLQDQAFPLHIDGRAQRQSIDTAHTKEPVIPFSKRQLIATHAAALLRHNGLLGYLARPNRYRCEVDPAAL